MMSSIVEINTMCLVYIACAWLLGHKWDKPRALWNSKMKGERATKMEFWQQLP